MPGGSRRAARTWPARCGRTWAASAPAPPPPLALARYTSPPSRHHVTHHVSSSRPSSRLVITSPFLPSLQPRGGSHSSRGWSPVPAAVRPSLTRGSALACEPAHTSSEPHRPPPPPPPAAVCAIHAHGPARVRRAMHPRAGAACGMHAGGGSCEWGAEPKQDLVWCVRVWGRVRRPCVDSLRQSESQMPSLRFWSLRLERPQRQLPNH